MDVVGYENLSLVGSGGNAQVYSARRISTGEVVAVKVLRGGGDAAVIRRFVRERDAMASLEASKNIAPILDSGATSSGDPFLVMPLFDGGSLQQRLADGPVPWREALALVRRMANAVAEAHRRRILHLDIKPANVLLDSEGNPFLADFGIAEAMGTTASMSAQMFTPAYTPPERLDGAKPSEHTDIYGLGGLAFALLTGQPPFILDASMSPAAMIRAVLSDDVPTSRLREVSPDMVVDLVVSTLSKRVEDRPQSAEALRDRIDKILSDDVRPALDPIIPFRLTSPDDVASPVHTAGETPPGSIGAEIQGPPGTPLSGEPELLSYATPLRPEDHDDEAGMSMVRAWSAAAAVFVCVVLTGLLTATVWNGSGSVDSANGLGTGLDQIADDRVDSVATSNEVTSSPSTSEIEVPNTADGDQDARESEAREAASGVAVDEDDPVNSAVLGVSISADTSTTAPGAPTAAATVAEPITTTAVPAATTAAPATTAAVPTTSTTVTERITTTTTAAPTTTTAGPASTTAVPTTSTTAAEPITTTTVAPTTTTAAPPVLATQLEFSNRIDIGDIGQTSVNFRFATSKTVQYTATIRSADGIAATRSGTASAGFVESVTAGGLTPGTDYTIQVTLLGNPAVSSAPVSFRTPGGTPAVTSDQVVLQNLRLVATESTRFEVNYESNICANGSFTIRTLGGDVVGSNSGQADGCTTRHLGVPGFWTPALTPNTTYVITVSVEANGQGQGGGNTASQSLTVTTSG